MHNIASSPEVRTVGVRAARQPRLDRVVVRPLAPAADGLLPLALRLPL
jgi:hypothetical protein